MKRNVLFPFLVLILVSFALPPAAFADSSHARIVRLSYVQGDVRFAREFHQDSLADSKAVWENGQLNLPIREGNALSTGNGRAEVEFENGTLAFLGSNTIIEFFDLSLRDGSRVTRLVLRQGAASFYDHSVNGDYFSVTGGDFTVEVTEHATFRLENFDDGSTVSVQNGRVTVLQNEKSTPLEKGQSLSVKAQEPANQVISRTLSNDDFDRWVSGRIQSAQAATNQLQPGAYSGAYVAGYTDLFTYGSWLSVNGFDCWRPFGVGYGWSPFTYGFGNWYNDASVGWTFIGSTPWGWLPYHYGGWYFTPVYGWVWNPGGLIYGRPMPYRPVTAVFVHSGNTLGVVPMNPADRTGKTPLNLSHGIYPVQNGRIGQPITAAAGEKWSTLKNPHSVELAAGIPAATAPVRVVRTIAPTGLAVRETSFGRGSSIVYDANEHRFVNPTQGVSVATRSSATSEIRIAGKDAPNGPITRTSMPTVGNSSATRASTVPSLPRASSLPPRPSVTPAPPRASSVGGGSRWSGSGGSSSAGASGGSSRSWGGSSSSSASSSSGGASHPSSTSSGGGRPH